MCVDWFLIKYTRPEQSFFGFDLFGSILGPCHLFES